MSKLIKDVIEEILSSNPGSDSGKNFAKRHRDDAGSNYCISPDREYWHVDWSLTTQGGAMDLDFGEEKEDQKY